MPDAGIDFALAKLAEGFRWQRDGVDHREREYVREGEEVWRDGDAFVHRWWNAHGWSDGPPDDVSEVVERWSEETLRARLGGELASYVWDYAGRGAPSVSLAFDPLRPMPGAKECALAVSDEDLDRVIGCLVRGYVFDRAGTEDRGTARVWGRERLRHQPPASSDRFHRTRSWARGSGDEVCVRTDTWDERTLREALRTRADIVHAESWPR